MDRCKWILKKYNLHSALVYWKELGVLTDLTINRLHQINPYFFEKILASPKSREFNIRTDGSLKTDLKKCFLYSALVYWHELTALTNLTVKRRHQMNPDFFEKILASPKSRDFNICTDGSLKTDFKKITLFILTSLLTWVGSFDRFDC